MKVDTKLKIWYKGRGKILEPFASKKDNSAKNVMLLLSMFKRLYLDSNKSAKWSLFLFFRRLTAVVAKFLKSIN